MSWVWASGQNRNIFPYCLFKQAAAAQHIRLRFLSTCNLKIFPVEIPGIVHGMFDMLHHPLSYETCFFPLIARQICFTPETWPISHHGSKCVPWPYHFGAPMRADVIERFSIPKNFLHLKTGRLSYNPSPWMFLFTWRDFFLSRSELNHVSLHLKSEVA